MAGNVHAFSDATPRLVMEYTAPLGTRRAGIKTSYVCSAAVVRDATRMFDGDLHAMEHGSRRRVCLNDVVQGVGEKAWAWVLGQLHGRAGDCKLTAKSLAEIAQVLVPLATHNGLGEGLRVVIREHVAKLLALDWDVARVTDGMRLDARRLACLTYRCGMADEFERVTALATTYGYFSNKFSAHGVNLMPEMLPRGVVQQALTKASVDERNRLCNELSAANSAIGGGSILWCCERCKKLLRRRIGEALESGRAEGLYDSVAKARLRHLSVLEPRADLEAGHLDFVDVLEKTLGWEVPFDFLPAALRLPGLRLIELSGI